MTESLLEAVLNLSQFHREHEKYYAQEPRAHAVVLQRHARSLQALADRWSTTTPSSQEALNPFEGSRDLNDPAALQLDGVLFMEGQGEPAEIARMKREMRSLAEDQATIGSWLADAMAVTWEAGKALLEYPELADQLGERHRIMVREFAEVFFDDVVVPADRMLGELNGGWAVAMSILPYERSSCFWQRIAYLYRRLEMLVAIAPDDDRAAEVVGNAFLQLHALRARSRATQHRLAEGATLGAETSIDKVLVAAAEQETYEAVRRLLPGTIETDDSAAGVAWRSEYLYSRAATIYGGTAEVQRNIIARRLLDLGSDD